MMGVKRTAKKAARAEHATSRRVVRQHRHPAVRATGKLSEIADQPPLAMISGGVLAAGLLLRQPAIVRTGARMLAAHALATAAKALLKNEIDRTRPARALKHGHHARRSRSGTNDSALNSFPSGHTAGAVSVAQAMAHELPTTSAPVRLGAATIGAIQVPRGAHYLSDVVVGAAVGWLAERVAGDLVAIAAELLDRRKARAAVAG